jgi:hypothetical protein
MPIHRARLDRTRIPAIRVNDERLDAITHGEDPTIEEVVVLSSTR